MTGVRIAILQAGSGIDPAANASALVAAIEQARAGGAAMLFTPEMSGMLDSDRLRALTKVRDEGEDDVLAAVRAAAAKAGIWVHLGSLALRGPGEKLVNRGFVIDAGGEIVARYDKIHLFDVDLPTGESWRESAMYAAGSEAVLVAGTPVGTLGLTICYDVRFPELFQRLSDGGADAIAVPAAFTVPTGQAHWTVLLRARAIEAEAFIIAAAQAGLHEDGRTTYGHSLIADPWGQVVIELDGAPNLAFADLELDRIGEVRARIPVLEHRRAIGRIDKANGAP